jgi:hypothetical protein
LWKSMLACVVTRFYNYLCGPIGDSEVANFTGADDIVKCTHDFWGRSGSFPHMNVEIST